jgi:hypothetical protein
MRNARYLGLASAIVAHPTKQVWIDTYPVNGGNCSDWTDSSGEAAIWAQTGAVVMAGCAGKIPAACCD